MGRQINFFLHNRDRSEFDRLIKSCGEVVILPSVHYRDQPTVLETTLVADTEKNGRRVHLVRPQDLDTIKLVYLERFGYWSIGSADALMVDFDLSLQIGARITRGRLYFQSDDLHDGKLTDRPGDFIQWGDKLIRTFRRRLIRHKMVTQNEFYNMYLGKNALEWVEQNDIIVSGCGCVIEATGGKDKS